MFFKKIKKYILYKEIESLNTDWSYKVELNGIVRIEKYNTCLIILVSTSEWMGQEKEAVNYKTQ